MRRVTLLFVALLPNLGGCVHGYCTLEMKYANVTLVDASGAPYLVDAVTAYTVDDGHEELCNGSGASWSCVLDTYGALDIRVYQADVLVAEESLRGGGPDACIESTDLEIAL